MSRNLLYINGAIKLLSACRKTNFFILLLLLGVTWPTNVWRRLIHNIFESAANLVSLDIVIYTMGCGIFGTYEGCVLRVILTEEGKPRSTRWNMHHHIRPATMHVSFTISRCCVSLLYPYLHRTVIWLNSEPCGVFCGLMSWAFLAYGMGATTVQTIQNPMHTCPLSPLLPELLTIRILIYFHMDHLLWWCNPPCAVFCHQALVGVFPSWLLSHGLLQCTELVRHVLSFASHDNRSGSCAKECHAMLWWRCRNGLRSSRGTKHQIQEILQAMQGVQTSKSAPLQYMRTLHY